VAEPKDLVLPLLREIQADLAAFRKETGERLTKLETGQRNMRSALAGEMVLSRMLVGEYEERIEAPERTVRKLEGQK
jgi:polyhydroxyalkanoate synthesis regulator phasin